MLADVRKKTVGRWVGWWFSLLLVAPAIVQAEQLPIKTYTTADGLAHDNVKCVVQDSHGFLWFCTVGGLSRFDGYRFTTYSVEHGLSLSFTNDIVETRPGVYWVATNGGGVCRFNPTARGHLSVVRGPSSVAEKQRTTDNGPTAVHGVSRG